jgi:hypothetical protein
MTFQPNINFNIDIDIAKLVKLIERKKTATAYEEIRQVARKLATEDASVRSRAEMPKFIKERINMTNDENDDTLSVLKFKENISQYQQERYEYYYKTILHQIKMEKYKKH